MEWKLWRIAAALVVAGGGTVALGQEPDAPSTEEPLASDRPDFVESSLTVGRGRLQVETSVARDRTDGATAWSTPTLVRFGIARDWEARLETDGLVREEVAPGDTATGLADPALGVKWHMADGGGTAPSTAWLLHVDLPVGDADFRGRGARPSLRAVMEWEPTSSLGVGVMPGLAMDDVTGERHLVGILAATAGLSWTDTFRTFVELAGRRLASDDRGGNDVTADAGATWSLSPDLQLDAAVAVGLTDAAADFGWTVGLCARW